MNIHALQIPVALVLVLAPAGSVLGQYRPAPAAGGVPSVPSRVSAEVLKGVWIRPDGGYRILIQGVAADGKLDAMYFNPARLPFAVAQSSQDGASFRVFLELQAGGYAGSTYELRYEPSTDRLKGTYYQAVAKQKFDVYFVRG